MSDRTPMLVLSLVALSIAVPASTACTSAPRQSAEAAPQRAVDAVISAFASHQIVALGDRDGWRDVADFALSVVADPRFAQVADDIVVECGNAHYQEYADAYIDDAGDAGMARKQLQMIWTESSALSIAAPSVCGQIFDLVRALNTTASRKLRIVLANPPIYWGLVHTKEDLPEFVGRRVEYMRGVLEAFVIARKRKALVIFNASHVTRQGPSDEKPLLQRVEEAHRGSTFAMLPYHGFVDDDVADRVEPLFGKTSEPMALDLKQSNLGHLDAAALMSAGAPRPWHREVQAIADVLVYLGPRGCLKRQVPTDEEANDVAWRKEVNRRSLLQFGKPFDSGPATNDKLHPGLPCPR